MRITIALFLLLFCAPSLAYFVDGNALVQDMREWERRNQASPHTDYTRAMRYSGYVIGVYDALELTDQACTPGNTSVGQVNAVVAKFLTANPERWAEPAVLLVRDALTTAFPCRARPSSSRQ
jgi:hypothetical protein